MEKRKWLWKRKSSGKSPGETESSESISSHSERYSDDQEALKSSPNHNTQSPEVTSKAAVSGDEINDSVKLLTEKLSAALVNVSAKEDLVKQHAKVAEEAVAGWEKAENEVALLKQQLDTAVQKNLALEDCVSHLDGALKECVRQLRQGREEQEKRIHEAVMEKTREWESMKAELESQFQAKAEAAKTEPPTSVDPDLLIKLESLEKENSALKLELLSRSEELEIRIIERDLSTQAAETASKQHLESIKKVAKLEAECRRLQVVSRKASSANDQKSLAASSIYVESLTDNQSDSGERLNALEIDSHKASRLVQNMCEPSCSDSWASALITELDQFKNEKAVRSIASSSLEIDIMDDFLEMEQLAALSETETRSHCPESVIDANEFTNGENPLKSEFEALCHRMAELEEKLKKVEAEKAELEKALAASQYSLEASQVQLKATEIRLTELQREVRAVNESKELIEFQLIGMEVEARTMTANVDTLKQEIEKEHSLSADLAAKCRELEDKLTRETTLLKEEVEKEQGRSAEMAAKCQELEDELTIGTTLLKEEVEKERNMSAEMAVKCRELEDELTRKSQEIELQQTAISNVKPKIKQEEMDVAAGKLEECQKTIASLGRQLQSLATLEDFLIDTANLPGFSGGGSPDLGAGELWKFHCKQTFMPRSNSSPSKMSAEYSDLSANGRQ